MNKIPRSFVLAFLPLALFAAPLVGQTCEGLSLRGASSPLLFADGFESGGLAAWGQVAVLPAFSLLETMDLIAEIELANLAGPALLELRFYAGEHLYQSISVPVDSENRAAAGTRMIPDYPFPVAIKSPGFGARRAASGHLIVEVPLPVAGTLITQNSLVGAWRVEAFLDPAASPCWPALSFRMDA